MKLKVLVLDSTLREGEQTPGVSFSLEEKLEIARKLDEIGVHMIEAGHPSVSKDVYEAVKQVAKENLRAEVLAHCRAVLADVDKAIECDVDRIAIFLGATEEKLKSMKMTEEKAIETTVKVVEHAKDHGFKVRFTAEDATRARREFMVKLCKAAIDAGADRISLPDTVGIMTPDRIRSFFKELSEELRGAELDAHCHNDLGLSVANALAAVEGGATAVHVTVNGLGERSGITPLEVFAPALRVLYGIDTVDLSKLPEVSRLVEKYSGVVIAPNHPIVGESAFSHKAGVHTAAVLFDPKTYEAFPPELVGRQREIVISKYTGKAAVEDRLRRLGITLTEEQLMMVVRAIKERPEVRRFNDDDLIYMVEKVVGIKYPVEVPRNVEALVAVKCESNVYTTAIARRILNIRGVEQAYEVSGDFDIEAKVSVDSVKELNECLENIRSIKGVVTTNTRMVLKKHVYK